MAKIALSELVNSIRGKVGNGIYQVWKGIQIIRRMPSVITQPNSTRQTTIRGYMSQAFNLWLTLTNDQQDSWQEMADLIKDYPLPPGGNLNLTPYLGGAMSGFNCFQSFVVSFLDSGIGVPAGTFPWAPLSEIRPDPPNTVQATYDNVAHQLNLTWVDPANADPAAIVRVWLRSRMGIYHLQRLGTVALGTGLAGYTGARSAGGRTVAFAIPEVAGNETVYLQMDTVNPSGLRSQGSNIQRIAIV